MKQFTEKQLYDFSEKVKELFALVGSPRVEAVYKEGRDAVVAIGEKKLALTMNSSGDILVAGYGLVEEAEILKHGVWRLTQKGKTYQQDILAQWDGKKEK